MTTDLDISIPLQLLRMQLVGLRKSKHLTQKELSNISGLSIGCISNIESGNDSTPIPSLNSVLKYVHALDSDLYIKEISVNN